MPRASASHARQVLALGAAITLSLVALDAVGLLAGWERLTWDLRFQHARLRAVPMSDSIRHVDIDDKAINNVGRWPWRRSRIAMAIDEIGRAGARVIAFDLLFDDPEEITWEPARRLSSADDAATEFVKLDHDAVLASAFSRTPSVLALNLGEPDSLGKEWEGEKARAELTDLLNIFANDISTEEKDAATRAHLTGPRKTSFLLSPGVYRSLAATRECVRLLQTSPVASFDALVKRVAPASDEHTASFPELPLLRHAWDQCQSWIALRSTLRPPTPDAPAQTEPDPDDRAPISLLAPAASATGGAGFVDFVADRDGGVRAVAAVRPAPTGEAIQFGIAAAARFLNISPQAVGVSPGEIVVGENHLPRMRGGRLLLDYPTATGGFLNVLQRGKERTPGYGHISIGALIDLAEQRAKIESNTAKLAAVTRIALGMREHEPVGEAEIARALDQGKSLIPQLHAIVAKGESLDEQERATLDAFTQQAILADEVAQGPRKVADTEATLRAALGGKLVFVGWSSTGAVADFVKTPLGSRTPGVVIHAVTADMALTGRAVRPMPGWLASLFAIILGMASAGLVARLSHGPLAITWSVLSLGYALLAGVLLFNWWPGAPRGVGAMFPLVTPLLTSIGAFFGCTALEAALSQRDRSRIERQFKARVSGQLVDYLVDNPGALSMSGQQREITSLFIDLAGFTAISERLDGPTTVSTLNRCMSDMTACLTAEGAYVNKFLGDGLMAFWSAFGEDPQQARRACRAAVECKRTMDALNKDPVMRGLPHLSARVGIATGVVVVGDCGAPPDLNDYTVIGNAVNLAARLESANKQFGTSILTDGRTQELVGEAIEKDKYRVRGLGKVIVVGQTKAVDVCELMPPDADSIRIELTTRAVELFQRGDFMISLAVWKQLEDEFGDAKLAEAYREGAAEAGDATNTQGAIRLRSK